jgi:cation transport regulator ChaC
MLAWDSTPRPNPARDRFGMWIFGYGSLMFDGWEAAHGCIDRQRADLPGYRRSFNKKSVESRGTPKLPGLTLNLAPAEFATCRGVGSSLKTTTERRKCCCYSLEGRPAGAVNFPS